MIKGALECVSATESEEKPKDLVKKKKPGQVSGASEH